ncbi:hypothetical protein G9A89_007031 [Geosiphon pyriformis]|nr:hypothetical protein G9A89_007031 [Geosiphon pyriformis]
MAKGLLKVTVVEGKEIRDKDYIGNAKVILMSNFGLRKIISKERPLSQIPLNPVWNENFLFNIHDTEKEHTLYVRVVDEDVVKDDKIGEGKVDLKKVFQKGHIDTWVSLPAWLGLKSNGEIHLILDFPLSV